jgi:hypothetical protein
VEAKDYFLNFPFFVWNGGWERMEPTADILVDGRNKRILKENIMKKIHFLLFGLMILSCSISINMLDTHPVENISVNVAKGKKVTASSYWYHDEMLNFPPKNVIDGKTIESYCTNILPEGQSYWLLAEKQTGWVQIDLKKAYKITKIRWLNTHNGTCMDRATMKYHIAVSQSDYLVNEETIIAEGKMNIQIEPQFEEKIMDGTIIGKYIRFYVDEYYGNGGGLNELEVYGTEGE